MSSYFDKMGRCLSDPKEVVDLVRRQYYAYLNDIQDNVVPEDEEKISNLILHFLNIERDEMAIRDPVWAIFMMHDLAHDVGRAGIRLRDGRRAGDNPDLVY